MKKTLKKWHKMNKARNNPQQTPKDKNKEEEWWWFWLKSESVLKNMNKKMEEGRQNLPVLFYCWKGCCWTTGQLDNWITGHFKSYWVCEWWELRLEPMLTSKKLELVLLQVNLPFYCYNSRFTNTSLLEIKILFTTKILLEHFGYVLFLILYK